MNAEKQSRPDHNGSALKQRLIVRVIAPLALPLTLGFAHSGCATKKQVRALEIQTKSLKEVNDSQNNQILTEAQTRNEKDEKISQSLQTQDAHSAEVVKKQNETDSTQDEKINTIFTNNQATQEEINRLKQAIALLQETSSSSSGSTIDIPENNEQNNQPTIDIAWKEIILQYLVEYRQSLALLPHFKTAMEEIEKATEKQRRNILKQVLTTGEAISYSHTRKPIRVSIPKNKTFDFAEDLKIIDQLSPDEQIGKLDEIINKENEMIKKMKEQQKNTPQQSSVPIVRAIPRPQDPQIYTIPSTPQGRYMREKDYIGLDKTNGDGSNELVPLDVIQTGVGKYVTVDLDLDQLPSNNAEYAFVIYGVRGIIIPSSTADKRKQRISFQNDIVIIEAQKSQSTCEIRLTDGMIYLFDISEQKNKNELNRFIQSRLNEETDMHNWPLKRADQVRRITIQ